MRYAAKLIFEYQVAADPRKRRTCESRIVVLEASSPAVAARKAKALGKREQVNYKNVENRDVSIRFLGLAELIDLEFSDDGEVWYSIFTAVDPKRFVKNDEQLSVFRRGPRTIGPAVRFAPQTQTKASRRSKRRP